MDRFKNNTPYTSEEEERRAKDYDNYMRYARMLSKEELQEAYVERMMGLDKYHCSENYKRQ